MSDHVMIDQAVFSPGALEEKLSIAMIGVGLRIAQRPDIERALLVANRLMKGYVIASEEQAVEVADLMAQVIDAEKIVSEEVRNALRIPKRMEQSVREAVRGVQENLSKARQAGNEARVAWQTTLRRRAVEVEEKARQAAQEAARIAAEKAAEIGEDPPPAAEVAPIEVPRIVSGGVGKMGTQVRIDPVEVVDWAACPTHWLGLATMVARSAFLTACLEKKVEKPLPGESVVWRGVRFEAKESAVNRR